MAWLRDTVPFLVQRAVDAPMRRSSHALDGARRATRIRLGALRIVQNVLAVTFSLAVLVLLFAIGLLSGLGPVRERLFGADSARAFPIWARLLAVLTFIPIGLRLGHGASGPFEIVALVLAATFPTVVLLSLSERLRGLVVGFIGDSYALLHEDGSHHAIVDRVRTDLARLEADVPGTPVVIAAHSQGAEIARRVLHERPLDAGSVAGLVTFGAGIAKLNAVDHLRDQSRRSWRAFGLRWASAVCAMSAVAVVVAAVLMADGRPSPASLYIVALAVALAAALIALAAVTLGRARGQLRDIVGIRIDGAALGIDERQLAHWTDLHASRDPVSEGRLPVDECTRGFSRTIVNRRSLALDHVAYWRNHAGFLTAVALEIERVAGEHANPARPPALADAERTRARTIEAIGPLRVATVALAGGLVAALGPGVLAAVAIAAAAGGLIVGIPIALHALAEARIRALMRAHRSAAVAERRPLVAA
jgi:hypothetical protein